MPAVRSGTTFPEVLVALVLLSATAAWSFAATLASTRSTVSADRLRAARHRADLALAELHALPCDSINVVRVVREPRWTVSLTRDHQGQSHRDEVLLRTTGGDSVRVHRSGWCS
jgi:Tfp pilus assembly protein FimT